MGRLLIRAALTSLASLATLAALPSTALGAVNQLDATVDLRAVASDGELSYLNGGLGLLRFDRDREGLRIGELRLGYVGQFADIVHVHLEAAGYGDHDRLPLDLTEAYVELRPYPWRSWRSRLKIGAFYAPISLENRLRGWRSAYSLTPSAINSWIGEELRTIGADYHLDWLGRQRGHDWELSAGAAVYGYNDPAGTLIAERGWALDDRQTTLFGSVSNLGAPFAQRVRPFYRDMDHRSGYYVDGSARYLDDLELRALHYDNRANPLAYNEALDAYAWHTWFDSAGARWTPAPSWTLISQWLAGNTCVGTEYCWHYASAFLLASWQRGPNMLSARYDDFLMGMDSPADEISGGNRQRGHAWTLAYERDLVQSVSLVIEAMQVTSTLEARIGLGMPPRAVERILQLAVRVDLN